MKPCLPTIFLALTLLQGCTSNPPLDPVTAISSGELTALQALYDVKHYRLEIEVIPKQKTIIGNVGMTALALGELTQIELDFDPRFKIAMVTVNEKKAEFHSANGKLLITTAPLLSGAEFTTLVSYEGKPYEAENPPWDGGFVWNKTEDDQHWIATAVQGRGCDLYWPCKDHISDKPERGADMLITVPDNLVAVMNGVLISEESTDNKTRYHWQTKNPISAYHLAINIGPFKTYQLQRQSLIGQGDIAPSTYPIVFYHITDDLEKIENLISNDFLSQLDFYERTLGPYPWGNEKVGIVEIPYLGMEHQTMNGYGNKFRKDAEGFDWLMQHEFAHEWFGNLMTQEASRDFWLHEGFANYMQPVYAQDVIGDAGFWSKMWRNYNAIASCKPVVPNESVSMDYFDSNDPYFKGSWTLHTLRWMMGEDKFWNSVRKLIYDTSDPWSLTYPITPTKRSSEDFVTISSEEFGEDLTWFFDAYLYSKDIPTLEVDRSGNELRLSFVNLPKLVLDIPVMVIESDSRNGSSSDSSVTTIAVRSDGSSHNVPSNARIQIDPEVKIFREFGTAQRCQIGQ
ncbi:MAG: aminopeptidase N [Pseudohongiellaceae bacterium]|jgi:aminopeptidase N